MSPRYRGGRRGADQGSTTVEAAGYTVLMLLVIAVLVQAAVWALADLSARHAADHGVQTARISGGDQQAGRDAAQTMLEAINPHGLTDVTVAADRGGQTTTVTVTGTALQVIPIVTLPVQAHAAAPTEPEQ